MESYIEVNRRAYDILYTEYARRAEQKSSYEEDVASLAGPALRYAKPSFEQISVLEIGPGSGEVLAYFEEEGCRTIAVELSSKIVEIARKRSSNTVFILGNILEVEFSDDQFEIIYTGALIHLFPLTDARRLLHKLHRWLKPNGILFVNTTIHPFAEEGYYIKSDYENPVRRFRRKWTEDGFLEQLRESGFVILEKLFTDEKDRKKTWVAFLCTKRDSENV